MRSFVVFIVICATLVRADPESQRDGRLLSLFQIVRFQNEACNGTNRIGTCYTASECTNRGGTSDGTCASGYGVCCSFNLGCGSTISENNTYFENPSTFSTGECSVKICKSNDNICQLRLDFDRFVIAGPSTLTVSTAKTLGGTVTNNANAKEVARASQCLTDRFTVTGTEGTSPPVICGVNTMEHMYVDMEPGNTCADLSFLIGANAIDTDISSPRAWSIRISQYDCNYENLAPAGCTQYFFGANTGIVQSFNFNNANGRHLADQNQQICVRRERSNCRICWAATGAADFDVSGSDPAGFNTGDSCCGYGATGQGEKGFDCLNIPGASKTTANMMNIPSQFCGRSVGLVSMSSVSVTPVGGPIERTICTTRTPFNVRFITDSFEFTGAADDEADRGDAGFRLLYTMSTGC